MTRPESAHELMRLSAGAVLNSGSRRGGLFRDFPRDRGGPQDRPDGEVTRL